MNMLKEKLRRNTGASLIIALVFMLFCIFVGGSILASAAANSARLNRTIADDQEYLRLRSAAIIVADQLRSTQYGTQLRFETEVRKADSGNTTTLNWNLKNKSTCLRDQMYFTAACRFYQLNSAPRAYESVFKAKNATCTPETSYTTYAVESNGENWIETPLTLTLDMTDGDTETNLTTIDALMVCGGSSMHNNTDDYNVFIYFYDENGAQDGNGKLSDKLHIEMTADGSFYDPDIGIFYVSWNPPTIMKGGR